MNDIQAELEGYIKKFDEILEVSGPIGDILIGALEKIKDSGTSAKVGKIVELTLGELGTMLAPINTLWNGHKEKWTKRQFALVKEMTGANEVSQETAVEILKLSRDDSRAFFKQAEAMFWEVKAKRLEQKLEAKKAASSVADLIGKLGRRPS